MNSKKNNTSDVQSVKESSSSIIFRWVWEGTSLDTDFKSWDLGVLEKKLEIEEYPQIENLLNKLCFGITRCILLSEEICALNLNIKKRSKSDELIDTELSTNKKIKTNNNLAIAISEESKNSNCLKKTPKNFGKVINNEDSLNCKTIIENENKLKSYHLRIYRMIASLGVILYKIQEDMEASKLLEKYKMHIETSINLGKTLGVVLGSSEKLVWNSGKNVEIASKSAWRILAPMVKLKLEDLIVFNRYKNNSMIFNPKELIYNMFKIRNEELLKINNSNDFQKKINNLDLIDFLNRTYQIINILAESSKSNAKISIIQILLLFDAIIFTKYSQISLCTNSGESTPNLISNNLNQFILSITIIVKNARYELENFIQLSQSNVNNFTIQKSHGSIKPLKNTCSNSEKQIIHLSLHQKLCEISIIPSIHLVTELKAKLNDKAAAFENINQLLAISNEENFSNFVKLLFAFSAYTNEFCYNIFSILIGSSKQEESTTKYDNFLLSNHLEKSNAKMFSNPITIPSSTNLKSNTDNNIYNSDHNFEPLKNIHQSFQLSYKEFLNASNIKIKLSPIYKFDLSQSIYNIESISNVNDSNHLALFRPFKYCILTVTKIGDFFNSCFNNFYLPTLLPLKILQEELFRAGQLLLLFLSSNVNTCIWALDEEQSYDHIKAKTLATSASLDYLNINGTNKKNTNILNFKNWNKLIGYGNKNNSTKLLLEQISLFMIIVTTIKNWLIYKINCESSTDERTYQSNQDNSTKKFKFKQKIKEFNSTLQKYIFSNEIDKTAGRLGFSVLVDLLWISSNILFDGQMNNLQFDKSCLNYERLKATAFNLLKTFYKLVNSWPDSTITICAFETQHEDVDKDINSYQLKTLDAIISGKLRRWAQIFDLSYNYATQKIKDEKLRSINITEFFLKNTEFRGLSKFNKEAIYNQSIYFGIFGCLRWLNVISLISQKHQSLSAEWEWSHLQRMPRICGKMALESILTKIIDLALNQIVFFGIYDINKITMSNPASENDLEPDFINVCLYCIKQRLYKYESNSYKATISQLDLSDTENFELEVNISSQAGNLSDPTVTQNSPVLITLDFWSLIAIEIIASLLGANPQSKVTEQQEMIKKEKLENKLMSSLRDLDFGNLKGEDIAKFILNKSEASGTSNVNLNTRALSFKPRSYLLTQSFASVGLTKRIITPITFSKILISLNNLVSLYKKKIISLKNMKITQKNLLNRSFTWLAISERIVAHSFLRLHFDNSEDLKSETLNNDDQVLMLSYNLKSNEKESKKQQNLFSQWWICTVSVAVNQVITALEKNNSFYYKLYENKIKENLALNISETHSVKFNLPSVHTLELHQDNTKSVILSLTAINIMLSLFSFLQFDYTALVSLINCQIPLNFMECISQPEKNKEISADEQYIILIKSSIIKNSTLYLAEPSINTTKNDYSLDDINQKKDLKKSTNSHSIYMLLLNILLKFPHSDLPFLTITFLQKLYSVSQDSQNVFLNHTCTILSGSVYNQFICSAFGPPQNKALQKLINTLQPKNNYFSEESSKYTEYGVNCLHKVNINEVDKKNLLEIYKPSECNTNTLFFGEYVSDFNIEFYKDFINIWEKIEKNVIFIFLKKDQNAYDSKEYINDLQKSEISCLTLSLLKNLLKSWKEQINQVLSFIKKLLKNNYNDYLTNFSELKSKTIEDNGIILALLNYTIPVFLNDLVFLRPHDIYAFNDLNILFDELNKYPKTICFDFFNNFLIKFNSSKIDLKSWKSIEDNDYWLASSILFLLPELYHDPGSILKKSDIIHFSEILKPNNQDFYLKKVQSSTLCYYQDLNEKTKRSFVKNLQQYILKSVNYCLRSFHSYLTQPKLEKLNFELFNQLQNLMLQSPTYKDLSNISFTAENELLSIAKLPLLALSMVYLKNQDQFRKELNACIKYLFYGIYTKYIQLHKYLQKNIPKKNIILIFPDDIEQHTDNTSNVLVFKDCELLCIISPFFETLIKGGFAESNLILVNSDTLPEIAVNFSFLTGKLCYYINLYDVKLFDFLGLIRLIYTLLSIDLRSSYNIGDIVLHEYNTLCLGDLIYFNSKDTHSVDLDNCLSIKTNFSNIQSLNTYLEFDKIDCLLNNSIDKKTQKNDKPCFCNKNSALSCTPNEWVSFFELSSKYLAQSLSDLCIVRLLNTLNREPKKISNNNILFKNELNKTANSKDSGFLNPSNINKSHFKKINQLNHEPSKTYSKVTEKLENSASKLQNSDDLFDTSWIPRFYSIIVTLTSWDISQFIDHNPFINIQSESASSLEKVKLAQKFPIYYYYPLNTTQIIDSDILTEEQLKIASDLQTFTYYRGSSETYKQNFKNSCDTDSLVNKMKNLYCDNFHNHAADNLNFTTLRSVVAINGLMKYAPIIESQFLKKNKKALKANIYYDCNTNLANTTQNSQNDFENVVKDKISVNLNELDFNESNNYKNSQVMDTLGFSEDDWNYAAS
ncbi:hypothetical protein BB561_005729 [Smittium simulii]|uniref:Uncharacterized protein n=1 Tax=Smittium simulii TaxID=133385 RepID=A0A2T9Y8Q9_9FUNG|nr:hypothetical protein BB561_005729 [Smittium simulii]